MRTELPKKWCVHNSNNCLEPYASKIPQNSWSCNSINSYYFYDNVGRFEFEDHILKGYTEITFEEFKILFLKEQPPQPLEPTYEIY